MAIEYYVCACRDCFDFRKRIEVPEVEMPRQSLAAEIAALPTIEGIVDGFRAALKAEETRDVKEDDEEP